MHEVMTHKVFGTKPPEDCWAFLGDLGFGDTVALDVVGDWEQRGSETYTMFFSADQEGVPKRLFVVKACIKFFPRQTMEEWIGRRGLLSSNGVITPELYVVDGATIIEEYIPLALAEAQKAADPATRKALDDSYDTTMQVVDQLGFRPVGLHDLRSHGDDVVMIDFGSDLGAPATLYTHTDQR